MALYITHFLQLVKERFLFADSGVSTSETVAELKVFYPTDVSGSPDTELLTTKEGDMLLSGLKKVINKTCSHKPCQ